MASGAGRSKASALRYVGGRRGRYPDAAAVGAGRATTSGREDAPAQPLSDWPPAGTHASLDRHLSLMRQARPRSDGCAGCLRLGSAWAHLRLCLSCGHVGCCDSSPLRHARRHAGASGHPIIQSLEPGEDWRWCYIDQAYV
jgi:ubiquitin-hydrolase Zn-finger-containing protein